MQDEGRPLNKTKSLLIMAVRMAESRSIMQMPRERLVEMEGVLAFQGMEPPMRVNSSLLILEQVDLAL